MNENRPIANAKHWHAGECGCVQLVMGLAREMQQVRPGKCLQVTALNIGARYDLPAWCRMTGNVLISTTHPHYILQKKTEL